ncbi:MAG: RNA pyrophosphohydrolase [Spirochaetes bacterium]|nr:RNA pyrophosphohydrolase [Spirochaetota bacterium]
MAQLAPANRRPYRPNVGIVVFNREGLTLVGERLDNRGAWQYPQGGVDAGENFDAAVRRELAEETGIHLHIEQKNTNSEQSPHDAELLFTAPEFLYYDFPPDLVIPGMTDRYCGQQQRWHLAYWDEPATHANLKTHTQEFASVRFMPMALVTEQIVPFKRAIYAELERLFLPKMRQYLDLRHDTRVRDSD